MTKYILLPLLSSDGMRACCKQRQQNILLSSLDSPPLLNVAERPGFWPAPWDTTILVVQGRGHTQAGGPVPPNRQARRRGRKSHGPCLNNLNFHSNGDSYYAYGYYSANGDRE